ncbi:MAG TPA: hypothetical protein VGF01_09570, partial [Terracidiphilus sp.]
GGFCKLSTSVPIGSMLNLTEVLPPGDIVSNITAAPPTRLGATNLGAGTATVTVGTGVTEVTYTDENQKLETGYLEICKVYKGSSTTAPPPYATFDISPGSSGPVVVPAGACSPAIEVPAGTVTITEVPIVGYAMDTCATIPAADQISCMPATWTDTVTVAPGNIPNQTVAIVTNSPGGATGGGCGGGGTASSGNSEFTLSAPGSLSVAQGGTTTDTVTVTDAGGFTGNVALSATGLPSGASVAFGTNPATSTSVLTISASSTATPGCYTVTITGTSGTQTATIAISLTIT